MCQRETSYAHAQSKVINSSAVGAKKCFCNKLYFASGCWSAWEKEGNCQFSSEIHIGSPLDTAL